MKSRAVAAALHAPLFGAEAQRLLLGLLLLFGQLKRPHLRGARRMVLAQRMTLSSVVRHQDALQVRMPVEDDAEHVPHFALVPVRRRPEARDAVERRAALASSATLMRTYSFRSNENR